MAETFFKKNHLIKRKTTKKKPEKKKLKKVPDSDKDIKRVFFECALGIFNLYW
jgi:hypothetical protein